MLHLSCQESPKPMPCHPRQAHTSRPVIEHVQIPSTPRHSGLPSPGTSLSHTMLRRLNHPARASDPLPPMLHSSAWSPIIAGYIPARIVLVPPALPLAYSAFG